MNGKPKPAFYIAVAAVVVALVAFAIWRWRDIVPTPSNTGPVALFPTKPTGPVVEEDTPAVLTTTVYEFVPAQTLPAVQGTSSYTPLAETDNTVRFAINVWAGWSPIILANEGFKPTKVWKTPQGKEFKVELRVIDDVIAMRDAYAAGQVHIGWATLDMIPLLLESFVDREGRPRDSRVMPRVYQQIDWSNGGDGIVVREHIKSVGDLAPAKDGRKKRIALAQNSPSHYFLLNMLINGNVQPRDVEMVFTKDAFQAAAAFNAEKTIDACVSWAPDIYNLANVRGNRMLVTTAQANRLIADVWFARADFARDHEDVIETLVRGIFDVTEELTSSDAARREAAKKRVAELMFKGYGGALPDADAAYGMLGDASLTNWADNYQFFMNQNNPTNFERTWNNAYRLYSHPQIRAVTHKPVPFNQVMDFTFIQRLGKEPKYAQQREQVVEFKPPPGRVIEDPDAGVLRQVNYIHFPPNRANLREKVVRTRNGKTVEEYYDPNVDEVLEQIGQTAGQFRGTALIIIEGHTDSSMRGRVKRDDLPELERLVKQLSEERAKAVMNELLKKFPDLNPKQFQAKGMGWDRPADPKAPNDHAKNRRVEVRVIPVEGG
jgi:outer membrane protein OmpA-like peptidoglycan-associated protein